MPRFRGTNKDDDDDDDCCCLLLKVISLHPPFLILLFLTYRRQQTNDEHLKSSFPMTNYRRLVLIQGYRRNKIEVVYYNEKKRKKIVQTSTFIYIYN